MKDKKWLLIIGFLVFLYIMNSRNKINGLQYTPKEIADKIKQKYNLSHFHYKLALSLIILESGAYKPNVPFEKQKNTMSPRTIENCKHYNYYNYTYFPNISFGTPNIYFDINYFSLEKFLESLSVVKIGVKDKTTFINMLTTSNTIQSFAEKVKYYGFTTFANNQQFQQYVNALNSIFNSLG